MMGLISVIRERFLAGASLPIGSGYISRGNRDLEGNVRYDYETMSKLGNDERVYSLIELCASMAYASFRRVYIRPNDLFTDNEMDKAEIDCVNEGVKFCDDIDVKNVFYAAARSLIQYGDYIEKIESNSEGVIGMIPMPIDKVSVIEERGQLGRIAEDERDFIMEKNYYVINEDDEERRKVYDKDDIMHISFNSRGQYKNDIHGRQTYGVWSKPPIYVLNTLVDWKNQSITADIKWKRKSVPREHWKLDVNSITPEGFEGTKDEKIRKAQAATNKMLDDFRGVVDTPQPDQSVITTSSVECDVLEPKSTTYRDPNEIIRQINGFLGTPMGTPEAFLGGKIENFAGTTMSSLFSEMRMDVICNKIAKEVEKVVRKHVGMIYPNHIEEVVPRLKIMVDSSLNQVMLERTRTAMMMVSIGLFTKEEIRGVMGYSGIAQNAYEKSVDSELRDSYDQQRADSGRVTNEAGNNNNSPSGNQNEALGRGVRDDKVKGGK